MSVKDCQGYEFSGATVRALCAYENGMDKLVAWRDGVEASIEKALEESPGFVMAHVLRAYLFACSRDPRRVTLARPVVDELAGLGARGRERQHVAAIRAVLGDDYEGAKALLGRLLQDHPRDLLALHVAHVLDYVTGDVEQLTKRVGVILPKWSAQLPGYDAVLAMHAFGLVEGAQYQHGADVALQAIDVNAKNARAYHALAHVYEMSGDGFFGLRWLQENADLWSKGTVVATHMWWHLALLDLGEGNTDSALARYDQCIRVERSSEMSDLIDSAALLWRLEMLGVDVGARWQELAIDWSKHIADGFCSFNDVHAMLAFVGAEHWTAADYLEAELSRRQDLSTRHGLTTRLIGLPACRAIIAYGRGDYGRAIELLSCLPASGHGMGGSHAQRDVLYLTLLEAIARVRRPVWRAAA